MPQQSRRRIETAILGLAVEPRPSGCWKLQGVDDTYRMRVGNYRVIYRVYDAELVVLIVKVGNRKDVYRK